MAAADSLSAALEAARIPAACAPGSSDAVGSALPVLGGTAALLGPAASMQTVRLCTVGS